jgi:hypothetical protein
MGCSVHAEGEGWPRVGDQVTWHECCGQVFALLHQGPREKGQGMWVHGGDYVSGMVWHGLCYASPEVNLGMVGVSEVREAYLTRWGWLEREEDKGWHVMSFGVAWSCLGIFLCKIFIPGSMAWSSGVSPGELTRWTSGEGSRACTSNICQSICDIRQDSWAWWWWEVTMYLVRSC